MRLSKRLIAVAEKVTAGNSIADIGTDHGFLPIELVSSGKCPYAIAMDVANGPLDRAKEHINEFKLNDRIECRLSDGLEGLEVNETDTIVIAGMGGDLIANILDKKPMASKELVLSPHTHPEIVRRKLVEQNYEIVDEDMIIDDGKYYVIIKALRGDKRYYLSREEEYFGKILLEKKNAILHSFLIMEIDKFKDIPQKNEYVEMINNIIW